MHLTATPSGEVAQVLASATSKQGLNREAQVLFIGKEPSLNALRAI